VIAVVAIGFALFRYGMSKQYDEDMRKTIEYTP
jgi:hypothetical protein